MSRKTTVAKSISLEPQVLEEGTEIARQRGFKNSFSAYVSWLIEQDKLRQPDEPASHRRLIPRSGPTGSRKRCTPVKEASAA